MIDKLDRRFDWYPIFTNKSINKLVDELANTSVELLNKSQQGGNAQKRRVALEDIARHLICALFINYQEKLCHRHEKLISIPLHKRHYHLTDPNKIPYVYPNKVEAVFKALDRLGWITIQKGQYRSSGQSKVTVFRAIQILETAFSQLNIHWLEQQPIPMQRGIEIRDKDKTDKAVAVAHTLANFDHDTLHTYQQNLAKINGHLVQQCIHLDATDEQLRQILTREHVDQRTQQPYQHHIDINMVQLRRIFAKGRLDRGGRFYGGWWQGVSSEHRPVIRINNCKTIEIDFSGIAINIIYALNKACLLPEIDVYDIGLPNWEGKEDKRRPVVKKAFNAFINDEKGHYRLSGKEIKALGCNTKELKEKIILTHPVIESVFSTQIGLEAQYYDSCVAEDIMLSLLALGITCLPIHDSFIVTASHWDILQTQMQQSFKKIMGVEIAVKPEVIKSHRTLHIQNKDMALRPPHEDILSTQELHQEFLFNQEGNLMQRYYKSYTDIKGKDI